MKKILIVFWITSFLVSVDAQILLSEKNNKDKIEQREDSLNIMTRNNISTFSTMSDKFAPDLPRTIPNTPEVNKLVGLIKSPVAHNTGLANLEIPIYDINIKGLTIPIKLVYNSSGFKPATISEAGEGWNLVAEPYIARQVEGLPDENYFYSEHFKDWSEMKSEDKIAFHFGYNDGEPDEFHYNLPNKNGSFFTKRSFRDKTIKGFATLPYDPITIEADDALKNIRIVDTDGIIYDFTSTENVEALFRNNLVNYTSSYKAKSIKTPNNESILFEYNSLVRKLDLYDESESAKLEIMDYHCEDIPPGIPTIYGCDLFKYSEKMGWGTNLTPNCPPGDSHDNYYYRAKYFVWNWLGLVEGRKDQTMSLYHYRRKQDNLLHKMGSYTTNENGWKQSIRTQFVSKITFPAGSVEILLKHLHPRYAHTSLALQSILIKDNQGNIIKKVLFDMDYESWTRPKLNSIRFLDKNDILEKKYSMEYEEHGLRNIDHNSGKANAWGYLDFYSSELPKVSSRIPYVHRLTNTEDTIAFITKEYGDYYISNIRNIHKGTMLKKITYPTGGYSTFNYEPAKFFDPERMETLYTGSLRIKKINNYTNKGNLQGRRVFQYGTNNSGLGIPVQIIRDSDFMTATQKQQIEEIGNVGFSWRIEAMFYEMNISAKPILDNYLSTSTSIVYDEVEESIEDNKGNMLSKTSYKYNYDNIDYVRSRRLVEGDAYKLILRPYYLNRHRGWEVGELREVTNYKFENNSYYLLDKIEYHYTTKTSIEKVDVLFVYPIISTIYMPQGSTVGLNDITQKRIFALGEYHNCPSTPFAMRYDGGFMTGAKVLNQTKETQYNSDGIISKVSKYQYNDLLMPTVNTTISSNGDEYKIITKYPIDNVDDVSVKMTKNNMINYIVNKELRVNNKFVQNIRTNYKEENTLLVPDFIETKINDVSKTEIRFNKYDTKGNLLQYTGADGIPVSYVWSYNYQHPIAEIKNATHLQVETAIKAVFGVSGIDVLANLNQIDETKLNNLRIYPGLSNAHVTTYYYKPLVGMVMVTGPSGITINYEYDLFNRLSKIYQSNGNKNRVLVNSYEYYYENK